MIESVIAESNANTVDRAAEQSVIAESGVLEQRVGHDEFPVEELNFVGGSVAAGLHRVRKEGGKEQGGDIYTQS